MKVNSISPGATRAQLEELFGCIGPVAPFDILEDPAYVLLAVAHTPHPASAATPGSRMAVIDYKNDDDAKVALFLNQTFFLDRALEITKWGLARLPLTANQTRACVIPADLLNLTPVH